MLQPTIMIADDDSDFLKIASEYLENKGYRVITTVDPEHARHLLIETPMATALIDIRFEAGNDLDERGLALVEETMNISSVPKIILTQTEEATKYAIRALRPLKGNRAPAVNFLLKHDGLPKMLETIEETINKAHVFLSYAMPDRAAVVELYEKLEAVGLIPWMDEKDLIGGTPWEVAVPQVMRDTDTVVVCLSKNSVERTGYYQKEIGMAIAMLDEMLEDDNFLIPARFEECDIKNSRLRKLHWVDLFKPEGFNKLVHAIRNGASGRRNKH